MHFAHAPQAFGNHSTRLVLVVVFHAILGIGLVKTMDTRHLSLPGFTPPVTLVPPVDPPVTPPPTPALPATSLPAPSIVVPMPELPVTAPPLQNQVTATTAASEPVPSTPPATNTLPTTGPATGTAAAAPTLRAAAMLDGCVKPPYPAQAARNGDTGTVTLALLVGVDGRVTASRIVRSSGIKELDKAAVSALSLCAFKPAMLGDAAQAGWASVAYAFTLD
jgi:protein TonB